MSMSNPAFRLILGDFNCRSNSWWKGNISMKEGIDLESVSLSHGLHQLITDPTHILPQSSTCIDLIFIDQSNLVIDSGVHSVNIKTAHDYQNLQFAIMELLDYITERKNEYNFQLSQILNNPATSSKTYWTVLKTFYSGKKIPLIPPLIINNQLITDFQEKANYFNLYFARQCTPIENDSSIPTQTNCLCEATIWQLPLRTKIF